MKRTITVFIAAAATVGVASSPLGRVAVDSRGRTLYLFEKDRSRRSACHGQCANYWPPLLAHGKPVALGGAEAGAARNGSGAQTAADTSPTRAIRSTGSSRTRSRGKQGARLTAIRRRLGRALTGQERRSSPMTNRAATPTEAVANDDGPAPASDKRGSAPTREQPCTTPTPTPPGARAPTRKSQPRRRPSIASVERIPSRRS
jgi:hypothetical protein